MNKYKKEFILIITMFLILTGISIIYKYINGKHTTSFTTNEAQISSKIEEKNNQNVDDRIFVDIDGEVKNPSLYEMKKDDRLKDLIDKAGGLTEFADRTKINLALKLKDEMKIHIYKIGEFTNQKYSTENESPSNVNNLININTASEEELSALTGIGPTKAKLIVEYREKNKFIKIEDITKVSGIGKKTFEKIKNKITVD